jgi:toxin FitB
MYLIDTCIWSDARRGIREATHWIRHADPTRLFISVITVGEIIKGISLKQRTDRAAANGLTRWLDQLRSEYADRILPVTDIVALEWGRLTAIRSRPTADTLIAATAIAHRLNLVTRNVVDFADTGAPIVNPFDSGEEPPHT